MAASGFSGSSNRNRPRADSNTQPSSSSSSSLSLPSSPSPNQTNENKDEKDEKESSSSSFLIPATSTASTSSPLTPSPASSQTAAAANSSAMPFRAFVKRVVQTVEENLNFHQIPGYQEPEENIYSAMEEILIKKYSGTRMTESALAKALFNNLPLITNSNEITKALEKAFDITQPEASDQKFKTPLTKLANAIAKRNEMMLKLLKLHYANSINYMIPRINQELLKNATIITPINFDSIRQHLEKIAEHAKLNINIIDNNLGVPIFQAFTNPNIDRRILLDNLKKAVNGGQSLPDCSDCTTFLTPIADFIMEQRNKIQQVNILLTPMLTQTLPLSSPATATATATTTTSSSSSPQKVCRIYSGTVSTDKYKEIRAALGADTQVVDSATTRTASASGSTQNITFVALPPSSSGTTAPDAAEDHQLKGITAYFQYTQLAPSDAPVCLAGKWDLETLLQVAQCCAAEGRKFKAGDRYSDLSINLGGVDSFGSPRIIQIPKGTSLPEVISLLQHHATSPSDPISSKIQELQDCLNAMTTRKSIVTAPSASSSGTSRDSNPREEFYKNSVYDTIDRLNQSPLYKPTITALLNGASTIKKLTSLSDFLNTMQEKRTNLAASASSSTLSSRDSSTTPLPSPRH